MAVTTKWVGVPEVVEMTGLTEAQVHDLCKAGEFPGAYRAHNTGSSPWKIPEQTVIDWLDIKRGLKRDDIEAEREK